ATWVGNFNGEPMRQVSGVTGAAPLWARIMLHLHEQQEPGALPTPAGMVKRPICALTGLKPTADCPSIVEEFFYPEDLVAYDPSPSGADQAEADNSWMADQDRVGGSQSLRILSPQEDDYFVLPPGDEQRLAFKAAVPQGQPVEWRLNGQSIGTAASESGSDQMFWPMQSGQWTLEASSGEQTDRVRFQVQPPDYQEARRGFSVVSPSRDR
ncbi:MAG: penicillin-binding protein 1C, partial [Cyanobacteria bacterium P01_F01_bin.4]